MTFEEKAGKNKAARDILYLEKMILAIG